MPEKDEHNGVVYQLTGSRLAVHCAVSLWTLRQHYRGPATIFASEDCLPIATWLASDNRLNVDIQETELLNDCHRENFIAKTWTYLESPYDHSVYLDADTVVMGKLDELFQYDFAVCQIADYTIRKNVRCARQYLRYLEHYKKLGPIYTAMRQRAVAEDVPVLNNGMLAFAKSHPVLWEMHHIAMAGRHYQLLGDNLALQIMLPHHKDITILDDKWNRCIAYSSDLETARVVHFHGQRWRTRRSSRKLWYQYLMNTIQHNVGDIQRWGRRYNSIVREMIDYGPHGKPQKDQHE